MHTAADTSQPPLTTQFAISLQATMPGPPQGIPEFEVNIFILICVHVNAMLN